jgi:hypothetical protein
MMASEGRIVVRNTTKSKGSMPNPPVATGLPLGGRESITVSFDRSGCIGLHFQEGSIDTAQIQRKACGSEVPSIPEGQ